MKQTKPLFLLIPFFVVVFMGCKKDGSIASKMDDKLAVLDSLHTYESDDTGFYDGEILLPDYVHSDTLVVISSKFINWAMEYYDAGSDGDISDILGEGTIPISDYADYIEVTTHRIDN